MRFTAFVTFFFGFVFPPLWIITILAGIIAASSPKTRTIIIDNQEWIKKVDKPIIDLIDEVKK